MIVGGTFKLSQIHWRIGKDRLRGQPVRYRMIVGEREESQFSIRLRVFKKKIYFYLYNNFVSV